MLRERARSVMSANRQLTMTARGMATQHQDAPVSIDAKLECICVLVDATLECTCVSIDATLECTCVSVDAKIRKFTFCIVNFGGIRAMYI